MAYELLNSTQICGELKPNANRPVAESSVTEALGAGADRPLGPGGTSPPNP